MRPRLGDELVRTCWDLLGRGRPYPALEIAERALRHHRPPADTVLAGRLLLVVGVALAALGRRKASECYLRDASWALVQGAEGAEEPAPRTLEGAAHGPYGGPGGGPRLDSGPEPGNYT